MSIPKIDPQSPSRPGLQIQNALLKHIACAPKGARLPPEEELCGHFDVSRMTVNKAIRKLVTRGILYRVRGKGTFVRKPPAQYRSVKILLPGPNSFEGSQREGLKMLFDSFCEESHRLSLRTEAVITTPDHRLSSLDPEMFHQFAEDDRVFVPSPWWSPILEALARSKAKVVYGDYQAYMRGTKEHIKNWRVLEVDNIGTARKAVRLLARAGRKRIAGIVSKSPYLGEPLEVGFMEGLKECGLRFDSDQLIDFDWGRHSLFPTQIFREMKEQIVANYRKKPFDGVASYPVHIPTFVAAIKEMRLRIPEDVAVISYDDSETCRTATPPISCFQNLNQEVGREAARILSKLEFSPGRTVFTRKFIDRGSV